MIRKASLFISLCFILTGCGATLDMWHADANMKNIELEMNKQEVINTLGKDYHRVSSFKTDDGVLVEILGYRNSDSDFYILQFENGILKEWHKEMRPANSESK